MSNDIIETLRWFPQYLRMSIRRSWTQHLKGHGSKAEDKLSFHLSDGSIDPRMRNAILDQARRLSVIGSDYFGSGYVEVKFEGRERGVLTRETFEYQNGIEHDVGATREPYRPRLRAYDQEGVYSYLTVYYTGIKNERTRFIQLVEASGNLIR